MKGKFLVGLFIGLVAAVVLLILIAGPKLFPKLESDAQLNDRLLFQQVVLPSTVDAILCKPSNRSEGQVKRAASDAAAFILPDGFTCLVKLVGQKSEQTFSTFAATPSEKNLPFLSAAAAGLRFSIDRSEMDNGRVKARVHVDDKSLVSVDEAAAAIKSVLTALAESPSVKLDQVLGAASEAEASRAWEAKRRANTASWSRP